MGRFNIRVYGIWVKDGRLLVTDEIRFGLRMTKLPGGGLEFGEGLEKCLKREWQEELAIDIEVGDIFYVNPFLQISAFDQQDEVMAHYFWVQPLAVPDVPFTSKPFDFPDSRNDQQVFRWIPVHQLKPEDFTFPIDQSLVPKLRKALLPGKTATL